MRPKHLKFPFPWESRAPLLLDDVLYVPKCYEDHQEWSKEELNQRLSSFNTVSIEYCSGNGTWIAEKAKAEPEKLWIAVEKRFDRVRRIWAKKHNFSLPNLLIVCGEALVFTRFYLKEACVDEVYVNFPDPWPKNKHAKNRIIRKEFVEELFRIGKIDAESTIVTDDEPFSLQTIEEMHGSGIWKSVFLDPFYTLDWPDYGSSFFESLWKEKGREIRYMKFKKKNES